MKRNILYTGMFIAGMALWTSCDHEPDFPGLDVKGETLTNVAKYADTYLGAAFTADNPAKETLPEWLQKKYYTCDKGSSAMITYKFAPSVPEYVSAVSAATAYTVTADDYKAVWEDLPFTYFSPTKKATQYVPGFLKEEFTAPVDKQLAVVNYNQADSDGAFDGVLAFSDNLESNSLDSWKTVVISAESANTNNWRVTSFGGNHYLQASAYNKTAAGPVETYLISEQKIDISDANLKLTFNALYANYLETGGRLTVWLSEDLAGFTKADVEAANWSDITSNFRIATSPDNTGDLTPAGEFVMEPYVGKKIYLAFKYDGDNTAEANATSTIRIDNVAIKYGEMKIADSYPVSAFYQYSEESAKWEEYTDILLLQPQDYDAMGVTKLTASSAQSYISAYLGLKYPYAQSGTIKAVGFKLAEDKFMAIELQKSTAGWTSTSDVVEMTDEYEYDGSAWVYKRTVPKAALNQTFDEDGRKITAKDPTMLEGWLNVALDKQAWYDKSYKDNNYTECTAYGVNDGAVDSWLITPALEIKSNYILTFDMTSGHWTHDALHVYISSSFSGNKEDVTADPEGTWKEVTENFNLPQVIGKYGTSVNVGSYAMTEYVGQQVYIAFRYLGDKSKNETSTVQLDNIYVGE